MDTSKITNQDEARTAYGAAAMRAGDLQYKIRCYEMELDAAHEEMKEINHRSIAITQAEAIGTPGTEPVEAQDGQG